MQKALQILMVVAIIGFATIGVQNIRGTNQKLEFKQIELKSTEVKLKNLNHKFDDLLKSKDIDSKKIKQLEKEKQELEKELLAKRERKEAEKQRIAAATTKVADVVTGTKPAHAGSCDDYIGLVTSYFPAHEVDNALLTMQRESGCRANAVSPTDDHGLMQINCRYHCSKVGGNVHALYDPETNIRLASEIFAGRGWNAWYAVAGILW